jgi:hypothetical protein
MHIHIVVLHDLTAAGTDRLWYSFSSLAGGKLSPLLRMPIREVYEDICIGIAGNISARSLMNWTRLLLIQTVKVKVIHSNQQPSLEQVQACGHDMPLRETFNVIWIAIFLFSPRVGEITVLYDI